MAVFLSNCTVKMKSLPVNNTPYVAEISFLKSVESSKGKLKKIPFKKGIGENPVAFIVLKEIEGKGKLEIRVYKKELLVKKYNSFFGQEGKYYDEVIVWRSLEIAGEDDYSIAVFLNGRLIYYGKLKRGN